MDTFFNPKSVVVFGTSDSDRNLGKGVLSNLALFKWKGNRWGIGRKRCEVYGAPVFTSLDELPEIPDLAIILTPAPTAPEIFEACGRKGIRRIIIESAGFGEWSQETADIEARLLECAKKYDIRFIGPNCMGTVNLPEGLVLNFGDRENFAEPGGVSVIAQSGGVFTWFASLISDEGRGINKGASMGNKLNVDEVDLLNYLGGDPTTNTIVMYLEDIRDGKKFMEAAQACSKPIITMKSNVFPETGRVAAGHTAAMASNDLVVDAAFKQCGVCRAGSAPELVNIIKAFALPPMRGDNLAVIARSGGHAVVAADRAIYRDFRLAQFSGKTMDKIEKIWPTTRIIRQNPLDVGDVFNVDLYDQILEAVLVDPNVDGVVFIHAYPAYVEVKRSRDLLKRFIEVSKKSPKPIALSFVQRSRLIRDLKDEFRHPIFFHPEDAIDALAAQRDWYKNRTVK